MFMFTFCKNLCSLVGKYISLIDINQVFRLFIVYSTCNSPPQSAFNVKNDFNNIELFGILFKDDIFP